MKTAILILAAGSSSRMGAPKQLLPYQNTTLLGYVIQTMLHTKADGVYCVLGAHYEILKKEIDTYPIQVLFNKDYQEGLASSIRCGLTEIADKDAVLIVLADQPDVTVAYINGMIDLYLNNQDKIIATSYDSFFGVPALFPKKYFKELKHLTGDIGAKKMLKKFQDEIVPINAKKGFLDIDTLNDYKKIFKKLE